MIMLRTLPLSILLGLSFTTFAQVYKSTDAEGKTIFSDTPTPGGQEVEIPETNVGDSFEVPLPEPEPKPEIVAVEPPSDIDGELIGEERKKSEGGGGFRTTNNFRLAVCRK
jgi:hypothetical protein